MNNNVSFFITLFLLISFLFSTILLFAEEENPESKFRPIGFFQHEVIDENDFSKIPRFVIKRARFGLSGQLTDDIRIVLLAGFFERPNNRPALVNGYIDFNIHPLFNVRAGQFVVPFGREGPTAIFSNPAIERPYSTRVLNPYIIFRDVGFQFSGKYKNFRYSVAWLNGSGANNFDTVRAADVVGRLSVQPFKNAEIGFSANYGNRDDSHELLRFGGDFRYANKPFLFSAEYQNRQDRFSDYTHYSNGGFILAGYHFHEKWQAILRGEYLDGFDPNKIDSRYAVMPGINFYYKDYSRVALNYEISDKGNMLILQIQFVL